MATKKPLLIQVTVTSISNGVENQVLNLEEGALENEELVMKCFKITDAINNAMHDLAELGGYETGRGRKG